MGEKIYFPLPDFKARYEQLIMNINNTFKNEGGTAVNYACLKNTPFLEQIARDTEGFSGRTLQKMINKLRQKALADGTLTVTKAVVHEFINKFKNDSLSAVDR